MYKEEDLGTAYLCRSEHEYLMATKYLHLQGVIWGSGARLIEGTSIKRKYIKGVREVLYVNSHNEATYGKLIYAEKMPGVTLIETASLINKDDTRKPNPNLPSI